MKKTNIVRQSMDMNRQGVSPLRHPRTLRGQSTNLLSSMPVGKIVPLEAIPLLREDSARMGNYVFTFEMNETVEMLMNSVNVKVCAHLVPNLVHFDHMDELDRAYNGDGDYFNVEQAGAVGSSPLFKYMGRHLREDQEYNDQYVRCYNEIVNMRRINRSRKLDLRELDDDSLAEAFWMNNRYKHIVPEFSDAVLDGEVALNIVNSQITVKGIGVPITATTAAGGSSLKWSGGEQGSGNYYNSSTNNMYFGADEVDGAPHVFAEMEENGITVSLSNIDLARKTQAFAKMREHYSGHSDDYIIDMLMSGLRVTDQELKNPILLAQNTTVFGQAKRYASDSGNLTESVVNGATQVALRFGTPKISCGGVIMITAEIMPDQLYERQEDPYLVAQSPTDLPNALLDELDPQKVTVVKNSYIDNDHATPDATFGYAPLNFQWQIDAPRVGGDFYRPEVDAGFDEKRQRIWAVETANPTLTENFYLVPDDIHLKPFVDQLSDPFEVLAQGQTVIEGLTVFGHALIENVDSYNAILDQVDQSRVNPEPSE